MKRLIVCGDSWMSASVVTPGLHFSEIVANKLGYELIPLARGGMSNGGIVAQIDLALTMSPDLILMNTTSANRIEFQLRPNTIGKPVTSLNFAYPYKDDLSGYNPFTNKDVTMGSDNLLTLIEWFKPKYFNEFYGKYSDEAIIKHAAINSFFAELYDEQWKYQMDTLIHYATIHKLFMSNTPNLIMLDALHTTTKLPWLPDKNIGMTMEEFIKIKDKLNPPNFTDPGYHTTPEAQEILANDVLLRLKNLI